MINGARKGGGEGDAGIEGSAVIIRGHLGRSGVGIEHDRRVHTGSRRVAGGVVGLGAKGVVLAGGRRELIPVRFGDTCCSCWCMQNTGRIARANYHRIRGGGDVIPLLSVKGAMGGKGRFLACHH